VFAKKRKNKEQKVNKKKARNFMEAKILNFSRIRQNNERQNNENMRI
jgi:hypothetical protein